jgi:histone H3
MPSNSKTVKASKPVARTKATKALVEKKTKATVTKRQVKPTKAVAKSTKEVTKKPHRFRAGTVAYRRIRKEQRLGDAIIKNAPLARLIKNAINDGTVKTDKGFKLSKAALAAVSEIMDHETLRLLSTAQKIASHGTDRITLTSNDLYLAAELSGVGDFLPARGFAASK